MIMFIYLSQNLQNPFINNINCFQIYKLFNIYPIKNEHIFKNYKFKFESGNKICPNIFNL